PGGSRIRTLGPALHTHRFGPPSCRPRDGPVRQTEITRWRPGTKRSTPASAAEYTGPPPGGSPLAGYRGGVISTHRPMGTPRARWCAPARSLSYAKIVIPTTISCRKRLKSWLNGGNVTRYRKRCHRLEARGRQRGVGRHLTKTKNEKELA